MRCVHESQMHSENSFITLTYNDEHLPLGGTLIKKHFQDFMKRLRRRIDKKVSYYYCGEYGEKCRVCFKQKERCTCDRYRKGPGRPHFHALLFGYDFLDKKLYRTTPRGDRVFSSEFLSEVWGKGFCSVGAVSFESAAYVARYIVQKQTGNRAALWYTVVDADGEIHELLPEFNNMSLKRPIGRTWYERFSDDVYPDDFVVLRGQRMRPPKFYDRLYEQENPDAHGALKEERELYGIAHRKDSTPERLAVRKAVKEAQISTLKRTLE